MKGGRLSWRTADACTRRRPSPHQVEVGIVDGEGEGVQGDEGPAKVLEGLLPAAARAVHVRVEKHAGAGVDGDEEELRGWRGGGKGRGCEARVRHGCMHCAHAPIHWRTEGMARM